MTGTQRLVPEQEKGSATGATSKKQARSARTAVRLFTQARQRLLDINNWQTFCGGKGAEFRLTDRHGNLLNGVPPEVGHLIRIKLPAPRNAQGDGYDWVRIEQFESREGTGQDCFGFRVRPVSNPADNSTESAHFYTSEATSSFLVMRSGTTVTALERGRNEQPNRSGGFRNRIRNLFVAIGAMLGLSVPQWKMLTRGLLYYREKQL